MGLIIAEVSHLDHGLTADHKAYLLNLYAEKDGFFLATVELPASLPDLECGLHGPLMGDAPVPEAECTYARRGKREGDSRICDRAKRPTRQLTVIAGPHEDGACVLYTAFGGPLALKEPTDPGLSDDERPDSIAFWEEHALSR